MTMLTAEIGSIDDNADDNDIDTDTEISIPRLRTTSDTAKATLARLMASAAGGLQSPRP